jgi:hypothetical protein
MRQRSVRACVRYVLEALMRRGDGPPRALRRDVALRRAASIEPNDALANASKCKMYRVLFIA